MIVCVTGATGFIGKQLCLALLGDGHEVRALGRGSVSRVVKGVDYFQGDLTAEKGDFAGFLSGVDVVFHCAGEILIAENMLRLHVDGTYNLLSKVQEEINYSKKPVRWVQLSSVGAYGINSSSPALPRTIDANGAECPENLYEITKTVSDHLVANFGRRNKLFSFFIVRPSIVLGASMPNQSFFQLAAMVKKGLFFYVGNKDTIANYVHVDDVVAAMVVCAFNESVKGGVYIVSNDCLLRDVVAAISTFYGVRKPAIRIPEIVARTVATLFSNVKKFPLSKSRIDALVRRSSYLSNLPQECLEFSYGRSIPEDVASILEGRQ